jgi:hypothetical protein
MLAPELYRLDSFLSSLEMGINAITVGFQSPVTKGWPTRFLPALITQTRVPAIDECAFGQSLRLGIEVALWREVALLLSC